MMRIWKKGICCLLIAAVMLSGIVYSPVGKKEIVAAEMSTDGDQSKQLVREYDDYDEDDDDYYNKEEETSYKEIRTVSELYAIRNDLKGSYKLMNDIDLSKATAKGGELDTGNGWTPIDGFKGKFDGNGYQIKGMTIYGEMEKTAGLFGSIGGGAIIMNLGMCDVNIDIKVSKNAYPDGDCGAIAGHIGHDVFLTNCFVSGKIYVECNYGNSVGGLVGNGDVSSTGTIVDCYNTASVQRICDGDSLCDEKVAGIGRVSGTVTIRNCYNYGSINNGNGRGIGKYGKNCVYLKGSGIEEGATPLTDIQMRDANYFTNFDFHDIWEVDADSSYPYPQLKSCMQVRIQNVVLEQMPVQTQYNQGDGLNLEGGRLLVTYEDGRTSSSAITDLMVSGYDMSQIGTQYVIVRRGNMTVSYPIVVNAIPVTEVNLDKTSLSLNLEGKSEATLTAAVVPSNATDQSITWATDNSNVVIVDQNGEVKALGNGTANVTATASNGISATCQVTVGEQEKKPQDIKSQDIKSGNSNARIKLGRVSISSIKVSGKKLIMRWKRISGASGYHIQIAKNRKFTKGKKNYNASGSQVTGYITGKKKTTYYIRMRAYTYDDDRDKVYGKYSAIKKKKIK